MNNNNNNNQIIHFMNILNNAIGGNILNRSFNDQGGVKKPCSESFIKGLEKITITNEDIDNNLYCAICQDKFKMGEKVIKLPCEDPHYYHFESDPEICSGLIPWFKENNSCPICRTEFPEENDIPVPVENFDNVDENNTEENTEVNNNEALQEIDNIIQRIFTFHPPNNQNPNQNPNMPIPPINLRNTILMPMNMIPYNEEENPDLQEAIYRSLES